MAAVTGLQPLGNTLVHICPFSPSLPTSSATTPSAGIDAAIAAMAGLQSLGTQVFLTPSSGPFLPQPASYAGIEAAMAAMAGLQPLGNTLETARVKTRAPFLLKGTLREYQHIGLDWLVTLYQKRLNGESKGFVKGFGGVWGC
jgi:hypothetical protein